MDTALLVTHTGILVILELFELIGSPELLALSEMNDQ